MDISPIERAVLLNALATHQIQITKARQAGVEKITIGGHTYDTERYLEYTQAVLVKVAAITY